MADANETKEVETSVEETAPVTRRAKKNEPGTFIGDYEQLWRTETEEASRKDLPADYVPGTYVGEYKSAK